MKHIFNEVLVSPEDSAPENITRTTDLEDVLGQAEHAALAGSNSQISPREVCNVPWESDLGTSTLPAISLSFSGAGLCGFYFNSICKHLAERRIRIAQVYGASAGALAGLSLLLRVSPACHEEILRLYDQHRSETQWLLLKGRDFTWESEIVKSEVLPVNNPELCRQRIQDDLNGRLHVAVTRVCGWDRDANTLHVLPKSVTICEWSDRADLVDCIKATMSIPGVTCFAPVYWRGAYWVDGGLLNSQPLPSAEQARGRPRVLTISPWVPFQPWERSWAEDLDLFRHLPVLHGALHLSLERRRAMFDLGVLDAEWLLASLQANGKLETPNRHPAVTVAVDSEAQRDSDSDSDVESRKGQWHQRNCTLPVTRLVHFAVLEVSYYCRACAASCGWSLKPARALGSERLESQSLAVTVAGFRLGIAEADRGGHLELGVPGWVASWWQGKLAGLEAWSSLYQPESGLPVTQ